MNREEFTNMIHKMQEIWDRHIAFMHALEQVGMFGDYAPFDDMMNLTLAAIAGNRSKSQMALTYFVYERDFGRKECYGIYNLYDENGNLIDLSDVNKLYDYIIDNQD